MNNENLPIEDRLGAFYSSDGVTYTVWAPEHKVVSVTINEVGAECRTLHLVKDGNGYFQVTDVSGRPGDRYRFNVDGHEGVADFVSRFQPEGVKGPSMVIDALAYRWRNFSWKRPAWRGQIVYEMHIGTFSEEGTFRGAIVHLDHLRDLGVTALEVMPVAERAGKRNWGYDGVFLFAPASAYGTPDDFREFIDACHDKGLAVILDVVFNHLGPQGNVAHAFSSSYFHSDSDTPWGRNFDLDGKSSGPVRAMLKQNIRYWMDEFRMDGFRFDATHAILDRSSRHILNELSEVVHERGGFLIAEDERNAVAVIDQKAQDGWHFDAAWADDFHHGIRVSQDFSRDPYYKAFQGTAAEIAETVEHGWLYRGRTSPASGEIRGSDCRHLAPEKFVYCISNHDQIGNRPFADRFHHAISPQAYRAVSLFFCLLPYTPMLFMGQEWAASARFHYFTDFEGELGGKMAEYRLKEFERLGLRVPKDRMNEVVDPQSEQAFQDSKLIWTELAAEPHREVLEFYKNALALRKELHVDGNPDRARWRVKAVGDVVVLAYSMPHHIVEIHFAVKASDDIVLPSDAKILMRSGKGSGQRAAETVVVKRSAS